MTIIKMDKEAHLISEGIKDRPFKMALCFFAIYTGVSGLMNYGTSSEIFDAAVKYSEIFNLAFIIAGMLTAIGIIMQKINVEAAGLCLISTSLVLRVIATIAIAGWTPSAHNLLALSVLFTAASVVRIFVIAQTAKRLKEQ